MASYEILTELPLTNLFSSLKFFIVLKRLFFIQIRLFRTLKHVYFCYEQKTIGAYFLAS
ncbi:hypothetical protein SAMN05444410_11097 [Hydrobacter penzbergensis]|uniref:Uncharacterized protein n=1 Tax=Hydrobacter penzbergensis TaxID=1235997 RepID=A0A8X8LEC3_9BACT|nr:hypothetical protein SAMN05444410_11097 [Hydrobacter penzbergensis]